MSDHGTRFLTNRFLTTFWSHWSHCPQSEEMRTFWLCVTLLPGLRMTRRNSFPSLGHFLFPDHFSGQVRILLVYFVTLRWQKRRRRSWNEKTFCHSAHLQLLTEIKVITAKLGDHSHIKLPLINIYVGEGNTNFYKFQMTTALNWMYRQRICISVVTDHIYKSR